MKLLTALPVFNEARHVAPVLREVFKYSRDVLVVDDGSSDGTAAELDRFPQLHRVTHRQNLGYGGALRSAFLYAQEHGFDVLVTIDCDGQHEPRLIPEIAAAMTDEWDIVSGSRYLRVHPGDSAAPMDRRRINALITDEVNQALSLQLTDAFCGFKAYRVTALKELCITELGYAMPLQLWVQAQRLGLGIVEFPVPLIYLDEKRSFGGALDDAQIRLAHYRQVLADELQRFPSASPCEPSTCSIT